MCIIIDTNTFSSVFDKSSANHQDFRPVLDWIISGKGKIVYGGTTYKNELKKARKYLKIMKLLNDMRKTIKLNDDNVDEYEKKAKEKISHRDFDDPQLIAIILESGCRLVCSCDSRSYPYLKKATFYPTGFIKPKIYCSTRNKDLLCDDNIPERYKPSEVINKALCNILTSNIETMLG